MAGPTTASLDDDIRELRAVNTRMADRMDRLADEIHEFRIVITQDLGAMRADQRETQASLRFALKTAAWGVGILAPITVGLVTFAVWAAFHAGTINNRLDQIEHKVEGRP